MHPLAYARGSVTLAESTRLLPSRDRQGAVSSEIPKTFKHPGRKPAAGLILSGCNPETQKRRNPPPPVRPEGGAYQTPPPPPGKAPRQARGGDGRDKRGEESRR